MKTYKLYPLAEINAETEVANLGWLFYREYYHDCGNIIKKKLEKDYKKKSEEEYKKKSKEYFDKKTKPFIESTLSKDSQLLRSLYHGSQQQFELKTTYPGLVTGIGLLHQAGLEGEYKQGFQFDYTTGLPCILGSSVKGCLRSAFPNSFKKNVNYYSERMAYIKSLTEDKELEEKQIDLLEYAIFAGTTPEGKSLGFNSGERDIFFDAFAVDSAESALLGNDYITPHRDPLKNPVPILFLKVMPNVTFRFSFRLSSTFIYKGRAYSLRQIKEKGLTEKDYVEFNAKDKLKLFRQVLLDMGIGAKTNVGYGQLSE